MNRIRTLLGAAALGLSASLPAQTLLLGYNFDEASSGNIVGTTSPAQPNSAGTINDVLGRGFGSAGTVTYTGDSPGGHSNGALRITTSGSYVLATNTTGTPTGVTGLDGRLDNLTAFTFSIWFKLDSSDAANFAALDRIVRAGATGGFGLRASAPAEGTFGINNFGLTLDINGGGAAFTGVSVNATSWVFLAVSVDLTDPDAREARLYVGTENSAASQVGLVGLSTSANSGVVSNGLMIGGLPGATTRFVTGAFDDFRVYNGAGDAAFVEGLRASNLAPIPEPGSFAALAGLGALGFAAARRRARA